MLLHDPFDFHAGSRSNALFASCDGVDLTFGEAQARSRLLAGVLTGRGVGRDDRFALLLHNQTDLLLWCIAASRLGAVPVPLNYRLAPVEWLGILDDAEAGLVVADACFASPLEPVLAGRKIQRVVSNGLVDGWLALKDLAATATPPPEIRVGPEAIMFQVYTSGTTGKPKGALLSHRAVMYNVFQRCLTYAHNISPGDRMLVVLPLFHVAALVTAFGAVSCGGQLVIHTGVDAQEIAAALARERITMVTLVPAVIQLLLDEVPGSEAMVFPDLKFIFYGASPIAEPVLRQALQVFRCGIAQGYGMTELAGSCCLLSEADHRRALTECPDLLQSAGRASPGCELKIMDPDGAEMPVGQVGEIVVRGSQMMSGYWKMPEATAEALRGGWMHTGDAGFIDEDGYLFLRDRLKDMIISGAENIFPVEIEAVIAQHAAVAEVAVIGIPDPRWGETVMAVVVCKKDTAISAAELDRHCRARLGGFKVPRRYEFAEMLPRNASGKILKRELRDRHWDGQQRPVG